MTQNGQGPEQGGAQAWGGAWGPGGAQPQPGGQPLPPAQPLPPEAPAGDLQATQYIAPLPQQPPAGPPAGYGYPPPVAAHGDMQATQHLAPVPGGMPPQGPPAGYGYPPPVAAHGDMQATQHLAPVPPLNGAGDGGQTQFLGTGPLAQPPAPAGASDATQYIAPVPGGPAPGGPTGGGPMGGGPLHGGPPQQQPPAEFDNLFRDSAPARPAPPAYQQPAPAPYQQNPQHPPHQPPPPPYGYQEEYYDEPEPRRKSPVALIAVVVAGCAVVGLGAGALLSGGDDDKKDTTAGGDKVAAGSPSPGAEKTGSTPAEKADDPAEPQAKDLDKLLATSNDSRDAVIRSVEAIKQCKDLDQAAADLRGAAEQRRGLVTKLQTLSVDKLPDSAALTAALTRAWQASAAADDHYAGWADQMKAKNGCKDGKARNTNRLKAADEKSGEATREKKAAAGLWNPTADKYGLTRRAATQL
ncbi:hypothetical protein [Streptomyces termitum]|uniref:hypothetical protein n=1 Tax=Streptomyces termitum TaxID=67368 RepID=UPI0033B3ABB6